VGFVLVIAILLGVFFLLPVKLAFATYLTLTSALTTYLILISAFILHQDLSTLQNETLPTPKHIIYSLRSTSHLIYFHHALLIYHHRLHCAHSPRDSYLSRPSRLWNLSGRLCRSCYRLLCCRRSNVGGNSWSYGSSDDCSLQHCIRNLSSCLCCRASRANPLSKGQLQPIR
jgi:hypothetical protein